MHCGAKTTRVDSAVLDTGQPAAYAHPDEQSLLPLDPAAITVFLTSSAPERARQSLGLAVWPRAPTQGEDGDTVASLETVETVARFTCDGLEDGCRRVGGWADGIRWETGPRGNSRRWCKCVSGSEGEQAVAPPVSASASPLDSPSGLDGAVSQS
jgi:hypothetical protein